MPQTETLSAVYALKDSHTVGIMTSRFSEDSILARFIRVSSTQHRSLEDVNEAAAPLPIRHDHKRNVLIFAGPASPGLIFHTQNYYIGKSEWFTLGNPCAIWQNAIVVASSIPEITVVIPDEAFGEIPLAVRLYRLLQCRRLQTLPKSLV